MWRLRFLSFALEVPFPPFAPPLPPPLPPAAFFVEAAVVGAGLGFGVLAADGAAGTARAGGAGGFVSKFARLLRCLLTGTATFGLYNDPFRF